MNLLIDPATKEAYKSLEDDHPDLIPDVTVGDIVSVSVAILRKIYRQWNSLIFTPVDVTDYGLRIAIGGFRLPTSGTFTVTFNAETSPLLVPYNPTALDLEAALNEIGEIQDVGSVDVTGERDFFVITFRDPGAQELIIADPANLIPTSVVEISRAVTGDIDTAEVQTLRIRQATGAIADLTIDSATPEATVEEVTQGSGTENHKVRITLTPNRWGGSWTYTSANVESDPIDATAGAEEIREVIGAISTVGGVDNVIVQQETEDTFLVTYVRGRGLQEIQNIDADGTALKCIGTKSGELDLSVSPVQFLIPEGEESTIVTLEVEATPAGGDPEKVLRRDVQLFKAVIQGGDSGSSLPPGTYFLTGLDGYVGGGPTKVDGAAQTVGRSIGSIYRGVVGDVLSEWELRAGTSISVPPGIIRPTDYAAVTNEKNLILVGG